MGKLILVRHGESVGNRDRTFTKTPDVPMTELGRRQALEAARTIGRRFQPARVIASPYLRARHTAEIIADELHLALEIHPDLYEQSLGQLAGKSYDQVHQDPDYDPVSPWRWRPRGGESHEDVIKRVGPALDHLARSFPREEIVVVSHGGVMKCLWAHTSGSWEGAQVPPNCGIVLVEYEGGRYAKPMLIGAEAAPEESTGG